MLKYYSIPLYFIISLLALPHLPLVLFYYNTNGKAYSTSSLFVIKQWISLKFQRLIVQEMVHVSIRSDYYLLYFTALKLDVKVTPYNWRKFTSNFCNILSYFYLKYDDDWGWSSNLTLPSKQTSWQKPVLRIGRIN